MALTDIFKRSADTPTPTTATTYSPGIGLGFGSLFNNNNALHISAVYRCVEIISNSIATLPIEIRKGSEVLAEHPLYSVFNDRRALLSRYELIKLLVSSVLIKGNGYCYIERNPNGTVNGLRFVEAGDVAVTYDKAKQTLYYSVPIISPKRIEPINMLHFVMNSTDGIGGRSVIGYATRAIANANNTENSANKFFENGMNLSGILSTQANLNEKQKQEIRESWGHAYTNGGSGLAVLGAGMEYKPIQINSKDAQLLEARQYNVKDVARFFGVSPSMLGDLSGGYYGSLEAEQQAFVSNTLQPYITMMEQELTRKLLATDPTLHINLDETALLKTDKSATATYFSTLVNNGILTRNEARKALGFAEMEGADGLTVSFTDIQQNTINKDNNDGNE